MTYPNITNPKAKASLEAELETCRNTSKRLLRQRNEACARLDACKRELKTAQDRLAEYIDKYDREHALCQKAVAASLAKDTELPKPATKWWPFGRHA